MTKQKAGRDFGFVKLVAGTIALAFAAAVLNADDLHQPNSRAIPDAGLARLRPKPKPPVPVAGDVLIVGGTANTLHTSNTAEFYHLATGKFFKTGKMADSRSIFGAVVLPAQGKVAVLGGVSGKLRIQRERYIFTTTFLSTAEVYDPNTGSFTTLANRMTDARTAFTATYLDPALVSGSFAGDVLIAGGIDNSGKVVDSAEIYNPAADTFTALTPTMSEPRAFHTATLLTDGTVLLAGGFVDSSLDTTASGDIYDPVHNTFSPVSNQMSDSRAGHIAVLLTTGSSAGDVLVAGGGETFSGANTPINSADLYNPATKSFSPIPPMVEGRMSAAATSLEDGRVLITAGFEGTGFAINNGLPVAPVGYAANTAEIFDPSTLLFSCVKGLNSKFGGCNPSMVFGRLGHTATLITSGSQAGEVLLTGGVGARKAFSFKTAPLKTAELFNPANGGAFTATGNMTAARISQSALIIP